MPRAPDPDYPHSNKKKIVVLVLVSLLMLLLAALLLVVRPHTAPFSPALPPVATAVALFAPAEGAGSAARRLLPAPPAKDDGASGRPPRTLPLA